jgi:hypothetical protein
VGISSIVGCPRGGLVQQWRFGVVAGCRPYSSSHHVAPRCFAPCTSRWSATHAHCKHLACGSRTHATARRTGYLRAARDSGALRVSRGSGARRTKPAGREHRLRPGRGRTNVLLRASLEICRWAPPRSIRLDRRHSRVCREYRECTQYTSPPALWRIYSGWSGRSASAFRRAHLSRSRVRAICGPLLAHPSPEVARLKKAPQRRRCAPSIPHLQPSYWCVLRIGSAMQ